MPDLGVHLISVERKRQLEVEGWTADHDDDHAGPALALAAICYTAMAIDDYADIRAVAWDGEGNAEIRDPWPWDKTWDKRKKHARLRARTEADRRQGRIRCLVIAGALIAAEIDRLQRETPGAAG